MGVNSTGTAAIVNGKLELNEQATDKSLAEFHAQDVDTINALEESSETEKTFFSMEPGRCVYHTVSAMGYSHLRSTLKSKPVCIKSKQISSTLLILLMSRVFKISPLFHVRQVKSVIKPILTSAFFASMRLP